MNEQNHLVFVLTDSITNSIFDGQIAVPLLKRQQENPSLKVTIISFEKSGHAKTVVSITQRYSTLSFIIMRKIPFITVFLLWFDVIRLRFLMKSLEVSEIIARGPLAGYLCLYSIENKKITIQLRGALAQEYYFAHHNNNNIFKKYLYAWRFRQYENLEKKVVASVKNKNVSYEVVSPTLGEYFVNHYHANPILLNVASYDVPEKINKDEILFWRQEIRSQLSISESNFVYCYNGSIRPWQCPEETISFFKEKLYGNASAYLLVVTQDNVAFEQLLQEQKIPKNTYTVITVSHSDIYKYLSACDAGIIFRTPHIINWVSRPTKVLEYQAVELPIIHNNTVAMLKDYSCQR